MAILDIDHFKRYNDQYGHLAGDRLLQDCANEWQRHLRPGDLLARYGGEEFAVLLRGCALRDARTVLERLRQATPDSVTCSLGVAERQPADTPETLFARADTALYQAKAQGRNQLHAA